MYKDKDLYKSILIIMRKKSKGVLVNVSYQTGGSIARHFRKKLAKSPWGTGLHNNRELECISWEGNRAEKSLHKLPEERIFLCRKLWKQTREVGLNFSLSYREELLENVNVKVKIRERWGKMSSPDTPEGKVGKSKVTTMDCKKGIQWTDK